MSKKNYVATVAIVLVGTGIVAYLNRPQWLTFKSTSSMAVSFDYPASVFHVREGSNADSQSIQIDNIDPSNIDNPNFDKSAKIIVVTRLPDSLSKTYSSVEEFLSSLNPDFATQQSKVTIAREQGYLLRTGQALHDGTYEGAGITFMHDKKLYSISIMNFSPEETKRIWQSLKFFKE